MIDFSCLLYSMLIISIPDARQVQFKRELPEELVIKKGSRLHLEIELYNSLGDVFWERDGEQLEDSDYIKLGSKDFVHYLEIDDMQSDDEGDFEVFVEHGDKEISCMCEVYINDTVDVLLQETLRDEENEKTEETKFKNVVPVETAVVEEKILFAVEEKLKPVVVECGEATSFQVILSRPADKYIWLLNNKEISDNNKYHLETNEDHYMLSIKNCDMFLDKTSIQFIGYLDGKEVMSQTKLTVIPTTPLLIEKCDLAQERTVGEDILLTVEMKGFDKPNIEWMKGFKTLSNNPNRVEIKFDGRIATLLLKNVITYDSGIFKCIVSEYGKKLEKKFNVKIKGLFFFLFSPY